MEQNVQQQDGAASPAHDQQFQFRAPRPADGRGNEEHQEEEEVEFAEDGDRLPRRANVPLQTQEELEAAQAEAAIKLIEEATELERMKARDAAARDKLLFMSVNDVRDIVGFVAAEERVATASSHKAGCVGANAMSVPLPPRCDSLHPPLLSAFRDAHEIYALKVKQRRDTTGENLIISPMLACMSPKILYAVRAAQKGVVSTQELTSEMATVFIDKLTGKKAIQTRRYRRTGNVSAPSSGMKSLATLRRSTTYRTSLRKMSALTVGGRSCKRKATRNCAASSSSK